MTACNSKGRHEKLAIAVPVLQNKSNLVILRCCFVENGKEMYKDLKHTCIATVLLIKPFVVMLSSPSAVRRRLRVRRQVKHKFIFYQPNSQLSRSVRCANGSKTVLELNVQWRHVIPNGNTKY